jgi:hypothetical protein
MALNKQCGSIAWISVAVGHQQCQRDSGQFELPRVSAALQRVCQFLKGEVAATLDAFKLSGAALQAAKARGVRLGRNGSASRTIVPGIRSPACDGHRADIDGIGRKKDYPLAGSLS